MITNLYNTFLIPNSGYISDEKEDNAAYFCSLIRGHWSIENQLHWHLDITFKEDACRTRTGYASQNLSVVRKMALHIVSCRILR